MKQTHAYYEEIDSIPASALDRKSHFEDGYAYIIHPINAVKVLDMSTRVLLDLKTWIEKTAPNSFYTRRAKHVIDFKTARSESLRVVVRELVKRQKRGDVCEEEGYIGAWVTVGEDGEIEEEHMHEKNGHEDDEEVMEEVEWMEEVEKKGERVSRHEAGQLEEAAEAGRHAAEEANERNEFEFVE